MYSLKAKFPGRPRHFQDSTGATKEVQRISYAERIQDPDFQYLQQNNEYFNIAAQTATKLRVFKQCFGSDNESEEEFLGFDEKEGESIKSKAMDIQREIYLLQKQIVGNNELSKCSEDEQIPSKNFGIGKMPSSNLKKVKSSGLADNVNRRRAVKPRSGKYGHITMLSPLPLSFVELNPNTVCISSIPVVKCLDDIPSPMNSASSSGKFIIENEEDSDDEDIENNENKIEETLLSRQKRPEMEKGLIRFNRYPINIGEVEVSGFPVIIDRALGSVPPKPLCFCCGSAGIEQLIYCSSCCEPYHPFCSGDDSLLSSYVSRILPKTKVRLPELNNENTLEVTSFQEDFAQLRAQTQIPIYYNQGTEGTSAKTDFVNPLSSLLSPPLTPMPMVSFELDLEKEKELELQNLLRNWTCRRCYTCYVCQAHRGSQTEKELRFLKCLHCPRVVHLNCSSTKKMSEKWICDDCFKCRSCGKLIERRALTNSARTKESNGQMLCLECFRRKQKGSFCPVCEVCYDDNDYETRVKAIAHQKFSCTNFEGGGCRVCSWQMMECGKCERWIHAKCERISEEQYQLLSNLPESIEYICRICEDPCGVFWRQAVAIELSNGCETVLRIFQKKAISSCRKLRVLQPSCDNKPPDRDVTDGCTEHQHHSVDHQLPKIPFSSCKENKEVVRELFPQNFQPDVADNELKVTPSKKEKNPQPKEFKTREVSILLHDYRKYPNTLLTKNQETNSDLSPKTCEIIPSFDDIKVEVKEYKTPIKPLLVEILPSKLPFSPSKRISTILDTVVQNMKFTSVMSLYEEALHSLTFLEPSDEDSNAAHLKTQFQSALKEVFPWFSHEEIANANLNAEKEIGDGKSLTVVNSFNSILSEEAFSKNPLIKPLQANEKQASGNPFADVYWDKTDQVDSRRCAFCQEAGDFPPDFSGRLLWAGLCDWVHVNCALWSSEVWEEVDGALQQVSVALARSKNLSCEICERKGASVSCCAQYCRKSFHFPCALNSSCILLEDKGIFCPDHVKKAKGLRQQDMQVLRQVYIDTDLLRKKEKQAWSDDLVVVIGSLRINSLGYLVPLSVQKSSDNTFSTAALVPLGYEVSRIFWSFDSSGVTEKVKYTIATGVNKKEARKAKYCKSQDINIRIDHTKPRPQVIRKWNQVRAFHDWLDTSPKYVDENGEEWLYPCNRTFTDTESSSGSDADVEDGDSETERNSSLTTERSTDYIHEDFFKDYLTDETLRHLSSCVEELIQENEDWGMEIMLDENDTHVTEDETEEDEELVRQIKASMCVDGKNAPFLIPQIDGGSGDSDSASYTNDDDETTSSSPSSSTSSSEVEERRRKISERKVITQRPTRANSKKSVTNPIPKPSKVRQKTKAEPRSAKLPTGKKSNIEFGGRKLRSRQKLKEAKIEEKKHEVKCQLCKKSFMSLASVKRHKKWCKPKKSAGKEKKSTKTTTTEQATRPLKSKRGRKPKKVVILANEGKKHGRMPERITPSTPSPSTSRQMSKKPKRQESESRSTLKRKMERLHVLRRNIEEHDLSESEITLSEAIGEDGKVHCKRCKNTYRTVLSYKNHTNNCFYFSSETEEEENEETAIEAPTVSLMNSTTSQIATIESESEETTSEYSTSSEGSLPITTSAVETNDETNEHTPLATEEAQLSQIPDAEMEIEIEKPRTESIELKSEDQDVNINEAEVLDQYDFTSVAMENTVMPEAETKCETVLQAVGYSMDSSGQTQEFEFQNEDYTMQLNEAESEVIQVEGHPGSEVYEANDEAECPEEFEGKTLETNGTEEDESMMYEDEAEIEEPVSHFISSETVINENEIGVVGYEEADRITPSQEHTSLATSPQFQSVENWNGSNVPTFDNNELIQHQQAIVQQQQQQQLVESLHQTSVLQQVHPQTFQNPQQQQPFSPQPQTLQVQQDIFPHEQQQQQQHLQTLTFQDSNGQLITLQVPIVHQMTPSQNTIPNPSFMSPNNQHPPPSYQQHQNQLSFQTLETQYEQYKHQIQAAIQLQRNSIQQQALFQQQQHVMLEQQQARNNRILLQHQQQPMQIPLQSSYLGSGQGATTPMLMSMNSNLFQQQNQQMTHVPVPIQAQPTIPASPTEGMTTYMVVQHGNTLSTIPIPFESQSTHNSTHQLTPIQISNPEFQGQRQSAHTPSPQHSTLLLPVLSESQGQTQSQGITGNVVLGNPSRVCLGQSTSTLNSKPCQCADCIHQSSINLCERKSSFRLKKGSPTPPDGGCLRKSKGSGKIRARLASMVTERQGPTLLPRLLPATTTLTTTTDTNGGFKSPGTGLNLQSAVIATTVTSDYFTGPIVSATATPSLLKAPTPSPNIAVVRPMEHPLQKMSDQIQQIESSFTTSTNQIRVSEGHAGSNIVLANFNLISEASTPQIIASGTQNLPNIGPRIPLMPMPVSVHPVTTNSTVEDEVREFAVHQEISPIESIQSDVESKLGEIHKDVISCQPESAGQQQPQVEKSIKIQLKRQEGGDSYSINKISGSASTSTQLQGMFKTLKIKGKITTGDQAGTSTDVVVQPVVHTVPIPDPNADKDDDESNRTIAEEENTDGTENRKSLETSMLLPGPSTLDLGVDEKGQPRKRPLRLTHRAVIVYEVKIDEKVQYKSCDVRAVWGYILERVQGTRRNHNLPPLSYPATNISLPDNKREAAASFNKLGLTHRAVQFLLEQLPGVSKAAKEGHVFKFQEPPKTSIEDMPVVENPTGSARSEGYTGRKPFDMFGWLASKHRQPEEPIASTRTSDIIKGGSLPIAMKYRNLMKYGSKHLNVFWSSIHGRGLFTTKDIEANDVIIEYAGEVIRSVLCDLREKYYESKGIGCYMFRMDDHYVVDATLKGNAARFINHSCDPNCRSRIMDILGTKHILIFALRKIPSGEELTYDYKFEEEDGVKLPCSCGTHKCRKFLN